MTRWGLLPLALPLVGLTTVGLGTLVVPPAADDTAVVRDGAGFERLLDRRAQQTDTTEKPDVDDDEREGEHRAGHGCAARHFRRPVGDIAHRSRPVGDIAGGGSRGGGP